MSASQKRLQFGIRSLLILTAFVAVVGGWWADRSRLAQRVGELESIAPQPMPINASQALELPADEADVKTPNTDSSAPNTVSSARVLDSAVRTLLIAVQFIVSLVVNLGQSLLGCSVCTK